MTRIHPSLRATYFAPIFEIVRPQIEEELLSRTLVRTAELYVDSLFNDDYDQVRILLIGFWSGCNVQASAVVNDPDMKRRTLEALFELCSWVIERSIDAGFQTQSDFLESISVFVTNYQIANRIGEYLFERPENWLNHIVTKNLIATQTQGSLSQRNAMVTTMFGGTGEYLDDRLLDALGDGFHYVKYLNPEDRMTAMTDMWAYPTFSSISVFNECFIDNHYCFALNEQPSLTCRMLSSNDRVTAPMNARSYIRFENNCENSECNSALTQTAFVNQDLISICPDCREPNDDMASFKLSNTFDISVLIC